MLSQVYNTLNPGKLKQEIEENLKKRKTEQKESEKDKSIVISNEFFQKMQ